MRIGFDIRAAQGKSSRRRGIGRYTSSLARALVRNAFRHEFVFYGLRGCDLPDQLAGRYRKITRFDRPRLNWLVDAVTLGRRIRRDGLQIFHSTEITAIPRMNRALVWATVHDLIPFVFWQETVRRTAADTRISLKWALRGVRRADRIITCSQHSKTDICRMLGFPESRVNVVLPGKTESLTRLDPKCAAKNLQDRYALRVPFLLYVGGSDFRKNLGVLVEAFGAIRGSGYPGKLVIAGETFLWEIDEALGIRKKVESLGLAEQVIFPGYVPDADLGCFYAACDLFVFPSTYEGFGLPVLEAMQCGAPVLCSRASSLPEVAGGAAAYFDPTSVDDMVRVFWSVYEDKERRSAMSRAGLEQASRFDWDLSAQQLLDLYSRYGAIE